MGCAYALTDDSRGANPAHGALTAGNDLPSLIAIQGLCYPPPATAPGPLPARVPGCRNHVETSSKGSAIARDLRVNQMIRIPQVRVVDEEGAQLGLMPTPQALAMAQERGYDLVEVAPMASPPVVKFLDFGQYKYELTKREKDNKRRQRSVSFKEVRLTPKIGSGDFDTKVHRAIEFLEDGDRIKVTVRFRGRELTHPELGRAMLARFTDRIKEHGTPERAPLLEGKSMHLTVASLHKPKEHEAPARAAKPGQPAEGADSRQERPASDAPTTPKPAKPTETEPKTTTDKPAEAPTAVASAPAASPAEAAKSEPAPTSGPAETAKSEPAPQPAETAKPEPTPQPVEATKAGEAARSEPKTETAKPEPTAKSEPAAEPKTEPVAAAAPAGRQANGTGRSQSAPRPAQRTTNDTPAEPAATGE